MKKVDYMLVVGFYSLCLKYVYVLSIVEKALCYLLYFVLITVRFSEVMCFFWDGLS